MQEPEIFETMRAFKKKFPVQMYICSRCGQVTKNPYICNNCGQQSKNLFKEFDNNYKFVIKEKSNEVQSIFKPIELKNGLGTEKKG